MRLSSAVVIVRVSVTCALVAGIACGSADSSVEAKPEPVPARLAIALTPAAEAFEVGTIGQVDARIFNQAGEEMQWSAPRWIEASDSSVLRVNADGSILARRVGRSWLRVTWAGRVFVRDSVQVSVGVQGVGTVRFVAVEGGCWVIEANPLTAYLPTNLPSGLKTDRLRVRYAARPSKYDGDFCMVGTLVDLDSIRVDTP
ncbi:MAG: hypothetical protein AABZ29_03600 [Gemmatimonadota bacterium]